VGAEKAPSMKDLGENEYSHFVCVEPTVASAVAAVPPGGTWVAYHEVERIG
jgi:D-hexose-6-phosphate mutarotase